MKLPKKYQERVWHWDDERDSGNSIHLVLNRGWCFEEGVHCDAFDTIKEAKDAIAAAMKCHCKECR